MKITASALVAGIALLGLASAAQAQVISDSIGANAQASWNTASSGTMALRSPGNLVQLGRADFRAAHASAINRSRFGPTIDEPAPTGLSLEQQVRVDVINQLFNNVNAALLAVLNSIRISGGLSPILPGLGGTAGLTSLLGTITGTG